MLDADDKLLVDSKDKKMTRDIIQFVPFMEHKDNSMLVNDVPVYAYIIMYVASYIYSITN